MKYNHFIFMNTRSKLWKSLSATCYTEVQTAAVAHTLLLQWQQKGDLQFHSESCLTWTWQRFCFWTCVGWEEYRVWVYSETLCPPSLISIIFNLFENLHRSPTRLNQLSSRYSDSLNYLGLVNWLIYLCMVYRTRWRICSVYTSWSVVIDTLHTHIHYIID